VLNKLEAKHLMHVQVHYNKSKQTEAKANLMATNWIVQLCE